MWPFFFSVEFFKKGGLTSTFKSIRHLTQKKNKTKNPNKKKKDKEIVITFVLCVWPCSQKLHGIVQLVEEKALHENQRAIQFLCNLGNKTIYPYLLNKAKNTSLKNFPCIVSEQRCAVLMKSSFSVYLGNSCTFFPAFVKSQYQLINIFVTKSSQRVYWSV